jgi:hypothetical protein
MQEIIFELLFPIEKQVEKCENLKKKRQTLLFRCPLDMGYIWDMAEKNTQSFRAKFRFSPLAPGCTWTRLRITQNLVEGLFLCNLYYFEVKRTLFSKYRIKMSR